MIKNICFKSLMLLSALLLLQGCSSSAPTVKRPRAKEYVGVVDYSKYNKEGFFITESNSVNFEYDPVATIYIISYEGVHDNAKINDSGWYIDEEGYARQNGTANWYFPTPDIVLDKAVETAKQKGADAIINIDISSATHTRYIGYHGYTLNGLMVTGMAIKRK